MVSQCSKAFDMYRKCVLYSPHHSITYRKINMFPALSHMYNMITHLVHSYNDYRNVYHPLHQVLRAEFKAYTSFLNIELQAVCI